MAKKIETKYITKADIANALASFDTPSIQTLRDDLKKCFPEKKPRATKKKDDDSKADKPAATKKPRATKKKAASDNSVPTTSKPLNTDEYKYKVGDSVFLWFGKDKLYATVTELLPYKAYKVEWTDFASVCNHPYVIGSRYKYVQELLVHDALESEVVIKEE